MSCIFSNFFLTKLKIKGTGKNVIYVVAFDPIKILTCWVLQNDRQNLSFVKSSNVVSKKMARNTCKMANSQICAFRFETEFRWSVKSPNFVK